MNSPLCCQPEWRHTSPHYNPWTSCEAYYNPTIRYNPSDTSHNFHMWYTYLVYHIQHLNTLLFELLQHTQIVNSPVSSPTHNPLLYPPIQHLSPSNTSTQRGSSHPYGPPSTPQSPYKPNTSSNNFSWNKKDTTTLSTTQLNSQPQLTTPTTPTKIPKTPSTSSNPTRAVDSKTRLPNTETTSTFQISNPFSEIRSSSGERTLRPEEPPTTPHKNSQVLPHSVDAPTPAKKSESQPILSEISSGFRKENPFPEIRNTPTEGTETPNSAHTSTPSPSWASFSEEEVSQEDPSGEEEEVSEDSEDEDISWPYIIGMEDTPHKCSLRSFLNNVFKHASRIDFERHIRRYCQARGWDPEDPEGHFASDRVHRAMYQLRNLEELGLPWTAIQEDVKQVLEMI